MLKNKPSRFLAAVAVIGAVKVTIMCPDTLRDMIISRWPGCKHWTGLLIRQWGPLIFAKPYVVLLPLPLVF